MADGWGCLWEQEAAQLPDGMGGMVDVPVAVLSHSRGGAPTIASFSSSSTNSTGEAKWTANGTNEY